MRLTKRGLIFRPPGHGFQQAFAQNPFPEVRGGGRYRVHVSSRDADNRARGAWFEIDVADPTRVLAVSAAPTLDLGELGAFDDCGVMPSCLVDDGERRLLYYTGWTRQVATPFSFFIGLAESTDGETFQRVSRAPVLGRRAGDPLLTASPWVLREGPRWRMWYVSATRWEADPAGGKPKHYYLIRHAESDDGIHWGEGETVLDFEGDEYALARPVVLRHRDGYEMWFCARGGDRAYRAAWASSPDGLTWRRDDAAAGLDPGPEPWDAQMVCYPCAFRHHGRLFVLYNGNDYGREGAGLASEA